MNIKSKLSWFSPRSFIKILKYLCLWVDKLLKNELTNKKSIFNVKCEKMNWNQVLLISSETTFPKQFITLKEKHCISELFLNKTRHSTTLINIWLFFQSASHNLEPEKYTNLHKCKYLFWLLMTVLWKNSIMKKQHYKSYFKAF